MLKKYRFGSKEELQEPIQIAKQAYALAKKIYGEKALVTNQTMLNYAMALTKNPDTREEGLQVLAQAEKLFSTINDEISFKEDCDLFFNMQLHY